MCCPSFSFSPPPLPSYLAQTSCLLSLRQRSGPSYRLGLSCGCLVRAMGVLCLSWLSGFFAFCVGLCWCVVCFVVFCVSSFVLCFCVLLSDVLRLFVSCLVCSVYALCLHVVLLVLCRVRCVLRFCISSSENVGGWLVRRMLIFFLAVDLRGEHRTRYCFIAIRAGWSTS